jgi:hypothetical protein
MELTLKVGRVLLMVQVKEVKETLKMTRDLDKTGKMHQRMVVLLMVPEMEVLLLLLFYR